MGEIETFFRQAEKIHDMHIKESESTDVKIATKRIESYFKGELKLGWKSIIYEINKLPELQRNKYFTQLVYQREGITRAEQIKYFLETIKKWSIFTFLEQRKKAPEFIEIQNRFIKNLKGL